MSPLPLYNRYTDLQRTRRLLSVLSLLQFAGSTVWLVVVLYATFNARTQPEMEAIASWIVPAYSGMIIGLVLHVFAGTAGVLFDRFAAEAEAKVKAYQASLTHPQPSRAGRSSTAPGATDAAPVGTGRGRETPSA